MLDVGDGNLVYWETCGNPDGKPALVVHGGPGSGCSAGMRRRRPDRYRIVLFDQRGCGRSTPHASDPATDMSVNTTEHLLADMERLREHLGIERWLLTGGSWGSTLILAYAERHPERVSEIVIVVGDDDAADSRSTGSTAGSRASSPRSGSASATGLPEADRDGDLVAGYARLMEHPDPAVRARAAHDWRAWEDAVISLEPKGRPNAYSDRPPDALLAFVRICTHYFAHGAWLEEGALLRDAGRLAGIPGVLIHGRLDMGGPLAHRVGAGAGVAGRRARRGQRLGPHGQRGDARPDARRVRRGSPGAERARRRLGARPTRLGGHEHPQRDVRERGEEDRDDDVAMAGDEAVDAVAAGEGGADAGDHAAVAGARQAVLGEPGAGAGERGVGRRSQRGRRGRSWGVLLVGIGVGFRCPPRSRRGGPASRRQPRGPRPRHPEHPCWCWHQRGPCG